MSAIFSDAKLIVVKVGSALLVDAATGEVLHRQPLSVDALRYERFRALGGRGIPDNDRLNMKMESRHAVRDNTPRPSPDGKWIAFLSDRPRVGYPAWWNQRPMGLFLIDAAGKLPPRVVAAESTTRRTVIRGAPGSRTGIRTAPPSRCSWPLSTGERRWA